MSSRIRQGVYKLINKAYPAYAQTYILAHAGSDDGFTLKNVKTGLYMTVPIPIPDAQVVEGNTATVFTVKKEDSNGYQMRPVGSDLVLTIEMVGDVMLIVLKTPEHGNDKQIWIFVPEDM